MLSILNQATSSASLIPAWKSFLSNGGPYKIYTHWKAFYHNKHRLKFKWEIKFIKGRVQAKRGRPRNSNQVQNKNARWRQKLENYQSDSFQKEGSAKVYVNFESNKLSMQVGPKSGWFRYSPQFSKFLRENTLLLTW